MQRRGLIVALIALTGCMETGGTAATLPLPPEGTPHVEISAGGTFSGGSTTKIFAGDILATQIYDPFESGARWNVVQGRPGVYDGMRAWAIREGRPVAARVDLEALSCPDFGSLGVWINPPQGNFAGVWTGCGDGEVEAFWRAALGELGRLSNPD